MHVKITFEQVEGDLMIDRRSGGSITGSLYLVSAISLLHERVIDVFHGSLDDGSQVLRESYRCLLERGQSFP